ncbi:alpha-amylase family glycosyl hydrolase [Candidatus Nitrospira allomarina]|uniref:Alpha-amylase family glycosyl hydrolase n=1 Tax=Candidatus Nitrospira allomarina TaxID=3020900 RepID=A0AA96G7L5_9BACT|nr:alpha-amylase family glycosyl hydrolase [Candidatus Nitrospira allomarina]WNM56618.1 alpha-amylase family glycosyl hydrolase [Candidatus Nitrospira allomarina]
MSDSLHWWQDGAIYQLLVPSFLDTNGDGYGDLQGITRRLEYLEWLGVRAIWLSPIYPSPLADLGYDITDYQNVEPKFGSLHDFDEMVAEAHRRNLKIILDWVPNHTSDEHPWFLDSRSNRESAKRHWYLWRDGKPDGSPPNNWISVFGGSVWQWDATTAQFYLHTFLDKQPDLNWRNPDVRAALFDTMRFWLERGVDGFRIDALDLLLKDDQFRDNPPNPEYEDGQGPDSRLLPHHTRDQDGIHEIVATMRRVAEEFGDDKMLAGELYLPVPQVTAYYGNETRELHLPLTMKLAWTPWTVEDLARSVQSYIQDVPPHGWPSWIFSTHDCLRLAMRLQGELTRVAAMLLLTLPGTPVLYYGEEIGMRGVPIPAEQAIDPQGRRTGRNRDPERTPMQWNPDLHAGFSSREPWLPIAEDFQTANVSSQSGNPRSLLTLYRRLFAIRHDKSFFLHERPEFLNVHNSLMAYLRKSHDGDHLVVLNFSGEPQILDRDTSFQARVCLSTFLDKEGDKIHGRLDLRGHEGLILSCD